MEVRELLYNRDSYVCSFKGGKKLRKLDVQFVQLEGEFNYILLTALSKIEVNGINIKTVHVEFLGISVAAADVNTELGSKKVRIRLVLDSLLHIVVERPDKKLLVSSSSAKSRETSIGAHAAAEGILVLVSDIENEEKKSEQEVKELQELSKKENEQMKKLKEQREQALKIREETVPGIVKHLGLVYDQLLLRYSEIVRDHAKYILDTVDIMIAPLSSDELSKKYRDWLETNRLAALSLPNASLTENMLVTDKSKRVIGTLKIYKFAFRSWKRPTASILFVTHLPGDKEPSMGIVVKDLLVRNGEGRVRVFGKLFQTQGIVSSWLPIITGEADLHPRILRAGDAEIEKHVKDVQSSAIISGTAYIIAKEFLE